MATPSTSTNVPENTAADASSSSSPIRISKRKLDDAFQSLDDALASFESVDRPSPPKRTHTARSLYSTLAKYGIKSKEVRPSDTPSKPLETLSKSTPHLTAILSRAATRTRKALPFKFSSPSTSAPVLSSTADYRPSSIPSFLSRLATFKLATYANKPPAIDAVAAAKCGWVNDGKDRLVCGLCNVSWVVAGREGMNRDAANVLIEKQRVSLVEQHKNGCPWKTKQCDASIYRIPLQSPAAMVRDIKLNAIALIPVMSGVETKHPLTSSQLKSLRSTISSFTLPTEEEPEPETDEPHTPPPPSRPVEPSETAILTSLFGWTLVTAASEPLRRTSSSSRATSVAPSPRATPSISRAGSVSFPRSATPTPGSSSVKPFTFRMSSDKLNKRDAALVQCVLCQRRVGLWAFAPKPSDPPLPQMPQQNAPESSSSAPSSDSISTAVISSPQSKKQATQRQFDLLKEHRSYCPYVVRSTMVPSLPIPSPSTPNVHKQTTMNGHVRSSSSLSQLNGQNTNGALEGWRAVLTVVLRYGMGQRQRMGLHFGGAVDDDDWEDLGEPMEVDGVRAMVAGVKSRGGRDLLKYVKGLLG